MENNHKSSVLVVDHEYLHIKTLTLILGKEYTIYAAKSGEAAIEVAEKYLPDLILLDVLMPGMDGYETITRLKSNPKTKNIPVIFITGLADEKDQVKGLEYDIVDYIAKPFNQKIVKLRIRNQIKIVNQMRAIEHLSRIDQLTNLPNRRYFIERMEAEWKVSVRKSLSLSLLILDIDYFKKYNDTYGYLQGDNAIREAAQIILRSIKRPNDFAARYGGEEFIVILPDTDKTGALNVAEHIRSNIESAVVTLHDKEDEPTKITVSVGLNTLTPQFGDSLDSFISCADNALYVSKENGRNRVSAYMAG